MSDAENNIDGQNDKSQSVGGNVIIGEDVYLGNLENRGKKIRIEFKSATIIAIITIAITILASSADLISFIQSLLTLINGGE